MKTRLARRQFLSLTACASAGAFLKNRVVPAAAAHVPVQAIAFDAFPVFDPRPIFALAEELYPGRGAVLSKAWRTRQFEYTWLRTVAGHYSDFWQVTEDALIFAAKESKIDLDSQRRTRLMNGYLNLKTWPDAPDALKSLKAAGVRLVFLSNFSKRMLEAGIKNSGLDGIFEQLLTTDEIKQFKPAARAYQMAEDALGLKRETIAFAAFAGWDASGAKWFGFPTVWVNRLSAQAEELNVSLDLICNDLKGLVAFVDSRR